MKRDQPIGADVFDAARLANLDQARPVFGRDRVATLHLADGRRLKAEVTSDGCVAPEAVDDVANTVHVDEPTSIVLNVKHYSCRSNRYRVDMETQHERLRRARLQAGFKSAAKAAEALGMPASSYTANENGQNGFGSDRAAIYGKRFGVHPAWLLLGDPYLAPEWDRGMGMKEVNNAFIGKMRPLSPLEIVEAQIESAERSHFEDDEVMQAPDSTRVAIVGYVGAGSEIFPEPSDAGSEVLDEVEIDFPTKQGTAAAIVRGDSMLPVFEDGDLIGYYRDGYSVTDMLGRQCVVKLSDGRMFLKTIKNGSEPGLFTLTSFNARDIEDVAVEWAAPFRFRISRFSWRRL